MTLRQKTRLYATPNNTRACFELIGTIGVFFIAAFVALETIGSVWLQTPFILIGGLCVLRIGVLQHDCGHNSFFTSKRANTVIGTILSGFCLIPFRSTQYNHNRHHAHIGDLEHRESSEFFVMTKAEYLQATPRARLGYRIYRSPITLFLLGPFLIFMLRYRWPKNIDKTGIMDAMITNAMLVGSTIGVFYFYGGIGLLVMFIMLMIGGGLAIFLFYVQHNFETTYWDRKPDLQFDEAALNGTSVIDFGAWFDFAVGYITYHDLHHLNAGIPFYRLAGCYRAIAEDMSPTQTRIGLWAALGCVRCKLWDEDQMRMVGFPKRAEVAISSAYGI